MKAKVSRTLLPALIVFLGSSGMVSAIPQEGDTAKLTPPKEALDSIGKFKIPEGFSASLWAAEPQLANPVAFCFDSLGRMYVAETFRQETEGVPDNRTHRYWLEDDLRLQTVEERGEMYLKHHPEYATEWTDNEDRISLLEDRDGDGMADTSGVFAGGFTGLLDGTGAGVWAWGDEVWYTCIPELWKLTDADRDGKAEQREVVHHGYGVRVAFRGHDMHGLTLGPDGRLYFSIGDRGYNVVTQEGETLKDPGRGAVFRCELDGSELEVFARGFRNPQELAFDDYGNLFTGDNNCDAGDAARMVWVMEGGDCGWSMNFQYLPDRGPWMSESWWKPAFEGQPAFLNAPLLNMAAGPSGFTHYPGVGLPAEMNDSFFLADFRGGPSYSGIYRFTTAPDGAGFSVNKPEQFWWGVLATDVDFGPDCSLYLSDWVSGWVGPGKGRIYKLSHDTLSDSELVQETQRVLGEGMQGRELPELLRWMGHADYRVRQRAQLACMAMGDVAAPGLIELAQSEGAVKPRLHAIWALMRLDQGAALRDLLSDSDAEVRAQAAKALGECSLDSGAELMARLQDESARVRYFACQALGQKKVQAATEPLFELLSENQDQDRFLRHAASLALARIGDRQALVGVQDRDRSVRLGAVLALRNLRDGSLIDFLADEDTYVGTEAAIAIYDLDITASFPALVKHLMGAEDVLSRPLARRALHACNRMGVLKGVIDLALDEDYDDGLRKEAADMLGTWMEPAEFDAMLNESRVFAARNASQVARELEADFGPLLASNLPSVNLAAIALSEKASFPGAAGQLLRKLGQTEAPTDVRVACLKSLEKMQAKELEVALNLVSESGVSELRDQALRVLASRAPEQALPVLLKLLQESSADQKATIFGILAGMGTKEADDVLASRMSHMLAGEVDPKIQVDLLEAVEDRAAHGSQGLSALIVDWANARRELGPVDALAHCLEGGDAEAGRKVFFENPTASCLRCHAIDGEMGDSVPPEVGPNLSGVGANLTRRELLASLVDPASKIASGFELYNDAGELLPISVMTPNLGTVLRPREIRDLVEYLSVQRKEAKVWVFVHSAGYEHQVAKAGESGESLVESSWKAWAETDDRFSVEISRDVNGFTTEHLSTLDAVFFYTTGEVPISEEGRAALKAFVEGGGGFVGSHCATDTFYEWPWYGRMLGGYFDGHPWNSESTVTVKVEDKNHCSTEHLGDEFSITDEIYQHKDPYSRKKQHVLMGLDTEKSPMDVEGIHRTDGDFAISWTKRQGKGRVFYTALGHRADVWNDPRFQKHLVEGMIWAAGR
ncbi:MAG: ThuA domain-containing protein [Planctomycetota bacterium]|nr:ThuA domain-containing protein [Planctomycetota bacterium]